METTVVGYQMVKGSPYKPFWWYQMVTNRLMDI